MNMAKKIDGNVENWESRQLGADELSAAIDKSVSKNDLDEALGLQMISIRLQKSLIEELKLVGELNGIGYQPLIRQLLKRFVDGEMKRFAREYAAKLAKDSEKPSRKTGNSVAGRPRKIA
jgi:predicted DNA binding CopG/RHH family protein